MSKVKHALNVVGQAMDARSVGVLKVRKGGVLWGTSQAASLPGKPLGRCLAPPADLGASAQQEWSSESAEEVRCGTEGDCKEELGDPPPEAEHGVATESVETQCEAVGVSFVELPAVGHPKLEFGEESDAVD